MSRTTTPRSYATLFSEAFDRLPPSGLPIFAKLATAINMAVADIPRGSSDSDRANAIEEIDSVASQILTDNLSEIGSSEDLKGAFTTLNGNPSCVEALLQSPHLTEEVLQSAMESAAASTNSRSIRSFELLLSRSRSPNYKQILLEALRMHKPGRGRNSVPFIRCVLQHMGYRPLPLTDQGVVRFAQAITAKTPEERAEAVIEAFDDLRTHDSGKHDTPEKREELAGQLLSGIKPDKQPWHKRVRNWIFKIAAKIFWKKKSTDTPNVTALIEGIKAEVRTEAAKKLEEAFRGKAASRREYVPGKPSGKSVSTVPSSTPTSDRGHAAHLKSSQAAGSKGVQP